MLRLHVKSWCIYDAMHMNNNHNVCVECENMFLVEFWCNQTNKQIKEEKKNITTIFWWFSFSRSLFKTIIWTFCCCSMDKLFWHDCSIALSALYAMFYDTNKRALTRCSHSMGITKILFFLNFRIQNVSKFVVAMGNKNNNKTIHFYHTKKLNE